MNISLILKITSTLLSLTNKSITHLRKVCKRFPLLPEYLSSLCAIPFSFLITQGVQGATSKGNVKCLRLTFHKHTRHTIIRIYRQYSHIEIGSDEGGGA